METEVPVTNFMKLSNDFFHFSFVTFYYSVDVLSKLLLKIKLCRLLSN